MAEAASCLGGNECKIITLIQTSGNKRGVPNSWGSTVFKEEVQKRILGPKWYIQLSPLVIPNPICKAQLKGDASLWC